ncbi:MAG: response regulator [Limisphaerales bacterium]
MVSPNETILIAEDDENDVLLLKRAFQKNGIAARIVIVSDGEQALNYLQGKGEYCDRSSHPFPSLILTDLKMPKRNGFEILDWLNKHPECSVIPTIVLTSSPSEEDISKAYRLGANSYFVKPPDFDQLQGLIKEICHYWSLTRRPTLGKC